MLHVLCRIGPDAYAITSEAVERIVPFATLKQLPGAPQGIAGLLNLEGRTVPVVDLCLLLTGVPAPEMLGTRILLCPVEESPSGRIGLLVEGVFRTMDLEEADFQPAGAQAAPCLDGVKSFEGGFLQRIEVPRILPAGILASLGLPAEFAANA
jgi:chemotaxis-related protein WspB